MNILERSCWYEMWPGSERGMNLVGGVVGGESEGPESWFQEEFFFELKIEYLSRRGGVGGRRKSCLEV
jgi:hypothetical protein